ncbi:unnamed protein product [Musa acuminata subsp. malaccensis]|uniref:(wild Malaysian banana) hypothetical protein n=1 Tax=Musa acuminata subsp. malaccensis TaxID=214687 RepID=A0A804KQC4_MUSAM|nr:unnamed protein product [Musa acuminata subsp. malaccensis]
MESLTLVPCFVCFLVLCLRDDDEGMMVEPFKAIGHEIFKNDLLLLLSVWDFVQSISANLRFLTCLQNDLLLL